MIISSTYLVGPRQCPGMGLALNLEGPLVVAALVHCFDFQLCCPSDEIKRIKAFIDEMNKLPLLITPRN